MSALTKANNTWYFKAFNEDYHIGGRYHSLGNSEFRCMVVLQSYADGEGNVLNKLGKGFKKNELATMVGLSGKTVELVMMNLENEKLISIDPDTEIIHLTSFLNDNVYRDHTSSKAMMGKRNLAKGIEDAKKEQAEQTFLLGKISDKLSEPQAVLLISDGGVIEGEGIKGGKKDAI